jgi:DNA-binding transcriptional regulator YiaG
MVDKVEIAPLFGLRGLVQGPVPGLRCDGCGEETFEAGTLGRMLAVVGRSVLTQPRILSPEEARFLRKAVLAHTQEGLAKRMGINKITVADWERGERPLSKEHDYEIRGIALVSLMETLSATADRQLDTLRQSVATILTAPRLQGPPRRLKRYVILASDLAAA